MRQLKNCKDKKCPLKDVFFEMDAEQIKEVLEEGICVECGIFVVGVLFKLYSLEWGLRSRDISNGAQIVREFPPVALRLLHSFCITKFSHIVILSNKVVNFTTIATEEFPKSVA